MLNGRCATQRRLAITNGAQDGGSSVNAQGDQYYSRPFTFDRAWVPGPAGQSLSEYACSENNIDAAHPGPGRGVIGPEGNRGYAGLV